MFSYYGSKSKLVHLYPKPVHDTIIEPFAGSARYALEYWERDVILIDKYDVLVRIWQYLQSCSVKDIAQLPNLQAGTKIVRANFDCIEQAWLMGFLLKRGSIRPDLTVSTWGEVEIPRGKKRIIDNLHKIKHWKILHGDYSIVPNQVATWFIDSPYEAAGVKYVCSSKKIDFSLLGTWCIERLGQTIVCESAGAEWLPFMPMKRMNGLKYSTVDSIWSNLPTAYDFEQKLLF